MHFHMDVLFLLLASVITVGDSQVVKECSELIVNSEPARIIVNQYEARAPGHHHRLESLVAKYMDTVRENESVVRIEYGGKSRAIGRYNITAYLDLSSRWTQHQSCYIIHYVIQDVNECLEGMHRCHSSAPFCIKVPESYECACNTTQGDYGIEGSGSIQKFHAEFTVNYSFYNFDVSNSHSPSWLSWLSWQWWKRKATAKQSPAASSASPLLSVAGQDGACGGEKTSMACCRAQCRGRPHMSCKRNELFDHCFVLSLALQKASLPLVILPLTCGGLV